MLGGWRTRWRRRRLRRMAWQALRELFDHPDRFASTSLRPSHRGRVDLRDFETAGEEIISIDFTILRHPRPYPFSRQHHEVVQFYRYELREEAVRHMKSLNLSRLKGEDGQPPGGW